MTKEKKCKVCLFMELGEQLLYEKLTRSRRHFIQNQRENLRLQFLHRSFETLTHNCIHKEVHRAIIVDYRKSEKLKIERALFEAQTFLDVALNNYATLLAEREDMAPIAFKSKIRHVKSLISQRRRRVRELKENLGLSSLKSIS